MLLRWHIKANFPTESSLHRKQGLTADTQGLIADVNKGTAFESTKMSPYRLYKNI